MTFCPSFSHTSFHSSHGEHDIFSFRSIDLCYGTADLSLKSSSREWYSKLYGRSLFTDRIVSEAYLTPQLRSLLSYAIEATLFPSSATPSNSREWGQPFTPPVFTISYYPPYGLLYFLPTCSSYSSSTFESSIFLSPLLVFAFTLIYL